MYKMITVSTYVSFSFFHALNFCIITLPDLLPIVIELIPFIITEVSPLIVTTPVFNLITFETLKQIFNLSAPIIGKFII